MVRIYVALLSKTEQHKPVLSCQKLKTLFFGLNIFKFPHENAMFDMRNIEIKLFGFFSPPLKSSFTSSLLKRTPLPILCVMPACAETATVPLQGPFIGTAVRGGLTTPASICQDFLSWQLPKKHAGRGLVRESCSGCGQGTVSAFLGMKDACCSPALPRGSGVWGWVRASFPASIIDTRAHMHEREHSGACARAYARPPACLPPAHLYVPGAMGRKGLSHTMALQLRDSQRHCWCCLGFASHVVRAWKRHHLCLLTFHMLILTPIPARGALLRQH